MNPSKLTWLARISTALGVASLTASIPFFGIASQEVNSPLLVWGIGFFYGGMTALVIGAGIFDHESNLIRAREAAFRPLPSGPDIPAPASVNSVPSYPYALVPEVSISNLPSNESSIGESENHKVSLKLNRI